jgi:hypothetical protein
VSGCAMQSKDCPPLQIPESNSATGTLGSLVNVAFAGVAKSAWNAHISR